MRKLLALSLLAVLAATGCDDRRDNQSARHMTSTSPVNHYVNTAASTIIYTTTPAKTKTRRDYRRERWESEKVRRAAVRAAKKKATAGKSYTVRKSYTAKSSRSFSRSARK